METSVIGGTPHLYAHLTHLFKNTCFQRYAQSFNLFHLNYRVPFLVPFGICAISGVLKRRKFLFPLKVIFVPNTTFSDTASVNQLFSMLYSTFIVSYYSLQNSFTRLFTMTGVLK